MELYSIYLIKIDVKTVAYPGSEYRVITPENFLEIL